MTTKNDSAFDETIKRLEDRGLIRRRCETRDKRRALLSLTTKG